MAGIIEAQSRIGRRPVRQNLHEQSGIECGTGHPPGKVGKPVTVHRCGENKPGVVEGKAALRLDGKDFSPALKFPAVQSAAWHAKLDAPVIGQIGRGTQCRSACEVGGSGGNDMLLRRAERDGDHVFGHDFAGSDTAVETKLGNIDEPPFADDFDPDRRKRCHERQHKRPQNLFGSCRIRIDPDRSGRAGAEIAQFFRCPGDLVQRRAEPRKEPLPRIRQRDIARRAVKKLNVQTGFEIGNAVAERRWAEIASAGGSTKPAELRHGDKGRQLSRRHGAHCSKNLIMLFIFVHLIRTMAECYLHCNQPSTKVEAMSQNLPFGFSSTATEVLSGVDLSGKTMIVTGGASGIGIETVKALAAAGASVTIAARRPDAAEAVAQTLMRETGNRRIDVRPLDLSDLKSVARFVEAWDNPLHALVNNAGIMALPELQRSAEGCEMQFATNFLGHFALTLGLRRYLAKAEGARVVSVSSTGSLFSPIFWDDPHFNFIPYNPLLAYGQSKTACILLSVGIRDRWAADGILSNALNPGAIPTNLQRHTGGLKTPEAFRKTPEQGASTSVLLAASPLFEGVSGRYFDNCQEAPLVAHRPETRPEGVASYALDSANAGRLWDMAVRIIEGAK